MSRLARALERSWHRPGDGVWPLRALAALFGLIVRVRRTAYARGWLRATRVSVPVLIVGNITVGGSGKTPLILEIVQRLQTRGCRVGVVSRGYGGHAPAYPYPVQADTAAAVAGDEPVLIARRTGAPVVVDPRRARAATRLVEHAAVDCVVADDGLQHYALARDLELVVTDSARGLGNRRLLPAGPLREPPSRMRRADLCLVQGHRHDFWLAPAAARSLADDSERALADFAGAPVHALAGIGAPERFFAMLRAAGLHVIEHPMPDHHAASAAQITFEDGLEVLMTEKDAVKCVGFAGTRHWAVPVAAVFEAGAEQRLEALLDRFCALGVAARQAPTRG